MIVHRCQQHFAQLIAFQEVTKFAHRGLIRGAFHARIDASEAVHRHRVVKCFFHRRGLLRPRNNIVHIGEKRRSARRLAVLLKAGQCRLLHRHSCITVSA